VNVPTALLVWPPPRPTIATFEGQVDAAYADRPVPPDPEAETMIRNFLLDVRLAAHAHVAPTGNRGEMN
jgi:hypothetical protein